MIEDLGLPCPFFRLILVGQLLHDVRSPFNHKSLASTWVSHVGTGSVGIRSVGTHRLQNWCIDTWQAHLTWQIQHTVLADARYAFNDIVRKSLCASSISLVTCVYLSLHVLLKTFDCDWTLHDITSMIISHEFPLTRVMDLLQVWVLMGMRFFQISKDDESQNVLEMDILVVGNCVGTSLSVSFVSVPQYSRDCWSAKAQQVKG